MAAIAMHAFILLAIGPFGQNSNSVVWPWNIAMICFLLILFWHCRTCRPGNCLAREGVYQRIVLVAFRDRAGVELLQSVGGYLSSALYSGVRNTARHLCDGCLEGPPPEADRGAYLSEQQAGNEHSDSA